MPDKEGDDEKKSTKSVVNKKQKQMMGEEGYDIARDMGRVRPSKDKKDATTMPVSKEMKKTQKVNKGPSALELVKKKYGKAVMKVGKKKANEELDLTQVAESFGGYIIEVEIKRDKSGTVTGVETTAAERAAAKKAQEKQREIFKKAEAKRDQKAKTSDGEDKLKGAEDQIKDIKTGTRPVEKDVIKNITKEVDDEQVLRGPRADRSGSSARGYDRITKMMRKQAAQDRRAEKLQDPKFRASETLRKAKPTDIKGGPSVKRGDPVPQEVIPVKKKPVPEIGGFQFNTFKDSEMKKRKTFKQAFGQPTGADPVTGKPTYMRPGALDKDGKPRPAQKRSKNLPDVDTVKTAIDMGVNPDEIDKNKFIDQKVRDARMKRLGTPDPFDPDYDKKVKKVDQRTKIAKGFKTPKFQTAQRPLEVDRETAPDPEKIASDIKKTGIGFQNLSKKLKNTKYTGVDPEFESGTKKGRIGTGTAMDPEVVTNGRANKAKNITNYKDPVQPSMFAKSSKAVSNFAKRNPVAALAAYDIGKGILGKISKLRAPAVVGGRAGFRSAGG